MLGFAVKQGELKGSVDKGKLSVDIVRELCLSLKETASNMNGVARELHPVKRFFAECDKPKLIGLGVTLLILPEPTGVSDVVGAALVSAGVIQAKMRQSALHIEDIYHTFPQVMRDLRTIKQGLV